MILERAAKLIGGRGARHDDGAAARARHIGMTGEARMVRWKARRSGDPEEAGLAGSNHLIWGRRTAASISSCACANSIIDPAAADDASHAELSSPDMTACRRVFTAVSARLTALMSSACAGFNSSGTAMSVQRLRVRRKPIAEADEIVGIGSASLLMSSRCAAPAPSTFENRRDAFM